MDTTLDSFEQDVASLSKAAKNWMKQADNPVLEDAVYFAWLDAKKWEAYVNRVVRKVRNGLVWVYWRFASSYYC